MGKKCSNLLEKVPCLKIIHSKYENDKFSSYLLIFLIAVIIIGYIIPSLSFGRPFGTDTYTHIFHAQEMYKTSSLFDFYKEVGSNVINPNLENNQYNYPFGSWLFVAVIAKVINQDPILSAYIFSVIFIVIVAVSFYIYSGLFLETKSQKLLALLFLFSMPNFVLAVNSYRPSTFIIPFLLLVIYSAYCEEMTFKNIVVMLIGVFAIAISHTGSFIFLMIFSIGFFWIYCLIGRKFSNLYFILTSSTFLSFWIAVKIFPHIHQQYATKSSLFLIPGDFLSEKMYIFFADDMCNVLYENLFINHQFVYVIIWSALIFAVGKFLVFLGDKIDQHYSGMVGEKKYAILPLTGMSHSYLATPFWIGPIHTILGIVGFFRLDLKAKCFSVAVVLTTVVPAIVMASEGSVGYTGALREISYMFIIIPIVSVLGIWYIIKILCDKYKNANAMLAFLFILLFSIFIVTPVIGNGYYLPSISGDDYIIEGMQWLSGTGDEYEKVVGSGYRTVSVYTQKIDAVYGLAYGTQSRMFNQLLNNIYFKENGDSALDIYSQFGTKYVLSSEKLISNRNFGDEEVVIDTQQSLDKIFSSKDFGIYAFIQQTDEFESISSGNDIVSMKNIGSNIEVKSNIYKVLIEKKTPTIKYIGGISQNLIGEGSMYDTVRLSWQADNEDAITYSFSDEDFTIEQVGNQIIYRTILKDEQGINNWSSAAVIYTFNPEMIKREFIISNDQIFTIKPSVMKTYFSTNLFIPVSNLVLKKYYKRIEKDIYPSDDTIKINDVYESFYLSNGNSGLYVEYGDTAPNPGYLSYKGSTAYDYTALSLGNSEIISPGASLHITQYLSVGSEDLSKWHIDNQNRISLYSYPNAIIPLVICGYDYEKNSIAYGNEDILVIENNSIEFTDVSRVLKLKSTLNDVLNNKNRGTPYTISVSVNPPHENILNCEGLRHPQIEQYLGEPTGTIILPASEPRTQLLSGYYTGQEFFPQWEDVIRSVSSNDDMALFLIRPEDVENPMYSQDFLDTISYAENSGLTQTSPEVIASHFKNLQQITFNSSFEIDEAIINVTNMNNVPVDGVTFAVKMPRLDEGDYYAKNGRIEKVVKEMSQNILYISVNLDQHESKSITVKPSHKKTNLHVEIPDALKEGTVKIVVKNDEGQPIENALIIIDDQPYTTNEYGNVSMYLRRGAYELTVEKAGYQKNTLNIEVKSYFSVFEEMLQSLLNQ